MQFEVIQLDNGIKWVKLIGRLDLKGTNEIDNPFTFATSSSNKSAILVDLSAVDFLASIGMRMLISNARAVTKRHGLMVLLKPVPLVKDVLITAGFDTLIPMYDDFDIACAALKEAVPD